MHDFESLAPVRWDCKYPVVFIPKYRLIPTPPWGHFSCTFGITPILCKFPKLLLTPVFTEFTIYLNRYRQ